MRMLFRVSGIVLLTTASWFVAHAQSKETTTSKTAQDKFSIMQGKFIETNREQNYKIGDQVSLEGLLVDYGQVNRIIVFSKAPGKQSFTAEYFYLDKHHKFGNSRPGRVKGKIAASPYANDLQINVESIEFLFENTLLENIMSTQCAWVDRHKQHIEKKVMQTFFSQEKNNKMLYKKFEYFNIDAYAANHKSMAFTCGKVDLPKRHALVTEFLNFTVLYDLANNKTEAVVLHKTGYVEE